MAELIFGDFVFDTRRLTVTGPAGQVPLRPRAREVLFYLIANRHRFVPRSELAQAVWHEETASPATINQTVSEVRRALGDSREAPAYIETRSKAGYRFVASVVHQATATVDAQRPPAPAHPSPPVRRPARAVVAITGGVLVLAAAMVLLVARGGSRALVVAPVVAEDDVQTTTALAGLLGRELEAVLAAVPFRVVRTGPTATATRGLVLSLRCRSVHGLRVEVAASLRRTGGGEEVWRGNWVAPPDDGARVALAREVATAVVAAAGARLVSP